MIRRAAELIDQAKRPIIIAGHGIIWGNAHQELLDLAEKADIPVITTFLGIVAYSFGTGAKVYFRAASSAA